jgi:ABC-type bacteriocin/lantibiotic exporter with double-glycine peptidase domain
MDYNYSIYHDVPTYQQPQTWACWYTSLQMVVQYQRNRGQGGSLVDPSENTWTQSLYDNNLGVGATPDEREKVALTLGFQVLYASVNADGLAGLLTNAPIVYAGHWPGRSFGHWVVIVGLSGSQIAINNPASGALETYDYNYFMGQYLLQSAERPLIFP